ncbi:hypothetical protein D3C76_1405920 [compost metagenome]
MATSGDCSNPNDSYNADTEGASSRFNSGSFCSGTGSGCLAIDSCTLIASDKAAAISANVRDSSGFSNETEGTEGIEGVVEADDAF